MEGGDDDEEEWQEWQELEEHDEEVRGRLSSERMAYLALKEKGILR